MGRTYHYRGSSSKVAGSESSLHPEKTDETEPGLNVISPALHTVGRTFLLALGIRGRLKGHRGANLHASVAVGETETLD